MQPVIAQATRDIENRSGPTRDGYRAMINEMASAPSDRSRLSCGNLAHGFAACETTDKSVIKLMNAANVGIVTAFNDMLSAQRPPSKGPDSNGSVGRSFFDAARRGEGNAEQGARFLFPTKGDR